MHISVIVPVYNTEEYLGKCIESILAQTFTDFELLLIDDGSTDRSGEICDAYAAKDARVKVFHKENGGVSRARNLGIENAQGEYLSFIDSDDTIRPKMYETLLNIANRHQLDLISSDIELNGKKLANRVPPDRVIEQPEIHDTVLPYFSHTGTVGTGAYTTMLIRRSVLTENNIRFYEDFAFQEDLMFVIRVYANISSMYYLPKTFYEYTTHPGGLYTAYRKGDGENFLKARKIMKGFIDQYQIPVDQVQFDNAFLYNIGWFIFRTLRLEEKKERKRLINSVLSDDETIDTCKHLATTAASFDRRIAEAIAKKKTGKAIFLIKFVHSGKAEKLQRFIGKIKGRREAL